MLRKRRGSEITSSLVSCELDNCTVTCDPTQRYLTSTQMRSYDAKFGSLQSCVSISCADIKDSIYERTFSGQGSRSFEAEIHRFDAYHFAHLGFSGTRVSTQQYRSWLCCQVVYGFDPPRFRALPHRRLPAAVPSSAFANSSPMKPRRILKGPEPRDGMDLFPGRRNHHQSPAPLARR